VRSGDAACRRDLECVRPSADPDRLGLKAVSVAGVRDIAARQTVLVRANRNRA